MKIAVMPPSKTVGLGTERTGRWFLRDRPDTTNPAFNGANNERNLCKRKTVLHLDML